MLPHPSPPANLGNMAIRVVLWRVLYHVFLTSEKTKKGTVPSLVESIVVG
jgi:hypothetical protein